MSLYSRSRQNCCLSEVIEYTRERMLYMYTSCLMHRYLKGLCEKTDGSCPLSHKISKEKVYIHVATLSPELTN